MPAATSIPTRAKVIQRESDSRLVIDSDGLFVLRDARDRFIDY